MPDRKDTYQKNAAGRYYVDRSCIGCTLCAGIAPQNFSTDRSEDLSCEHDFVKKQPENKEEEAACQEAEHMCPVGAIGSDGDD